MPTRPSVLPPLTKRDLEACDDASSVFTLFRKLRYPVEDLPVHVPLDDRELPRSLREGIATRYPVAHVGGRRPGDPLLSVTLFELKGHTRKSEVIRGVAQTWTRRFLGEHLLVFAAKDLGSQSTIEKLAFVNTRRLGEEAQVRIKLHKLLVERRNPTRHDLDTLNRIALPPSGLSAERLYQVQCEAFDVERLTNTFYREYAQRFRAVQERIKQDNPNIAAFSDTTRLHTFTQRLFGRLMFLYFLQKKGALNKNPQFIKSWYEGSVQREENFYRSVLEPLFFETLNLSRPEAQSRFGRVPYLNGGLFSPDDDDHVSQVFLTDEIFDTRHTDGLLYFLENHNFTIEEDTPLEVEVALDPEMLGKVFENLLEVEERGKSGTFYTPRPVVIFMCREALASYLTHEVQLPDKTLGWLLDEAETGEPVCNEQGQPLLDTHSLPRLLRERVDRALGQVRLLDPAVGSGAFPLGMLALLVGVRRALYRVAGVSMEHQTPLVEGWKRNFIRDCLYGVDVKREAIEIARLRLWLSLVVDADPFEMEPLPNLDFKLIAGDSLIETINGTVIYPTRPTESKASQLSFIESETQRLIHRLRELKDEYFQPSEGRIASSIKQQILQMERAIVLEALREREQQSQERLDHLGKSLVSALSTSANRTQVETLRRDIQTTQQTITNLEAGKTLPLFLYRLHFASVFEEKDGFDIVIANPPYVSIEHMKAEQKEQLKKTYPEVADGRADLYVYFYTRALQLLRQDGILVYISSNKFFRARYGKGLRELLAKQTRVQLILDFGDTPVFDAAAYPCIVLAAKSKPALDHLYRGMTTNNQMDLEKIDTIFAEMAQTLPQAQGVQPPSSSSSASAIVQKLMQMGTPLGRYANRKIYYGIKTGLNDAFVINQATHNRLITEDPLSSEVLKPFLRGRDVGRYAIHSAGLWLIYTYHGIDIQRYPAIEAYLRPYKVRLEQRATKQEWYELQQPQFMYKSAFERSKIIYPDIALHANFAFEASGAYPDCTDFCIPTEVPYLVGILNSKTLALLLMHLSPSVHGDFHRYKKEYMEQLPIVEPSLEDQARLAALVNQLQVLSGQGVEAAVLEREVDAIVYQTYGLSEEEIAEIEHWHAERRAQLGTGQRRRRIAVDEEAEA